MKYIRQVIVLSFFTFILQAEPESIPEAYFTLSSDELSAIIDNPQEKFAYIDNAVAPYFLALQEKLSSNTNNPVDLLELCNHIRRGGKFTLFDTACHATDSALTLTQSTVPEDERQAYDNAFTEYKKHLSSQEALVTTTTTRGFTDVACNLLVKQCLRANGKVLICGDTHIENNLTVKGNTLLSNTTINSLQAHTIKGAQTIEGKSASFNTSTSNEGQVKKLTVTGDALINNSLSVKGKTSLSDLTAKDIHTQTIQGKSASFNTSTSNEERVKKLTVTSSALINSGLSVKGKTSLSDLTAKDMHTQTIQGKSASFTTSTSNEGQVKQLTVTGDAFINNGLSVKGKTSLSDLTTQELQAQNISVGGNIEVNGAIIGKVLVKDAHVRHLTITGNLTAGQLNGLVHAQNGLLATQLLGNDDIANDSISGTKIINRTVSDDKLENNPTSDNIPNAIVKRDPFGAITVDTVKGMLLGNATTATTAESFSNHLQGEVTGPQAGTVVSNAVSTNTPNTIIRRDNSGSFATTDVLTQGNISFDQQVSSSDSGMILKDTTSFLHNKGLDATSTFLGLSAGSNNAGITNTGTGYQVLASPSLTGAGNTGSGAQALTSLTTGTFNTADGMQALQDNTQGSENTATGFSCLKANQGSNNSAHGAFAMASNTSGGNNSAYGTGALPDLTTGGNNIALGSGAGTNLSTGGNNIYIQSAAGSSDEMGTIRIGTDGDLDTPSQQNCFIAGIIYTPFDPNTAVPVLVNPSTGQLGVSNAPEDPKENVQDIQVTDTITKLHPVSFNSKNGTQYALLAKEVAQIDPNLVVHAKNKRPHSVNYTALIALLLKQVQQQQKEIEQLQTMTQHLENIIKTSTNKNH